MAPLYHHPLGAPKTPLLPCPLCKSSMQWKQNRSDGGWFMGCTSFPTCNGTRNKDGLSTARGMNQHQHLVKVLKAAILASDDDVLVMSQKEFDQVDRYNLHIENIEGDKWIAYVQEK